MPIVPDKITHQKQSFSYKSHGGEDDKVVQGNDGCTHHHPFSHQPVVFLEIPGDEYGQPDIDDKVVYLLVCEKQRDRVQSDEEE